MHTIVSAALEMFAIDDNWGDDTSATVKLCDQMFGSCKSEHVSSVSKAKTKGKEKKRRKHSEEPMKSSIRTTSKISKRLEGGRFRWINEQLYSMSSKQASELFSSQPELYQAYHSGFRGQVEKWPVDPVDNMIHYVTTLPEHWIIADMGCGEAKLSATVSHKVHSFDLVASNDSVTVSDMASVPLDNNSVNVVIFCLSLMGTNLNDFIREAHRILVSKGILKITEICSRIDDIDVFVQSVCSYGFTLVKKKNVGKIFVDFQLEKIKRPTKSSPIDITLNPCLYKRR